MKTRGGARGRDGYEGGWGETLLFLSVKEIRRPILCLQSKLRKMGIRSSMETADIGSITLNVTHLA